MSKLCVLSLKWKERMTAVADQSITLSFRGTSYLLSRYTLSLTHHSMDWTGGVRRRFAAGKNNAQVQRQKAHFAKVRGASLHVPALGQHFMPDFLRDERSPIVSSGYRGQTAQDIYTAKESRRAAKRDVSPAYSARSSHRVDLQQSSRPVSLVARPNHLSADDLLQATRKRLLARSDWLGLSVTRPVHMDFRSAHDKDRIGKRRKLDNPSQRAKPAAPRPITPLFEERIVHPDEFMTGALPREDISIRVGSNVMPTDTQHSRRSYTPINTSVRPMSIACESISEESMLLGAEGDQFEESLADSFQPCLRTVEIAEAVDNRLDQGIRDTSLPVTSLHRRQSADEIPTLLDTPQNDHKGESFARSNSSESTSIRESSPIHVSPHRRTSNQSDEDMWRQLVDIPYFTSSRASVAVLRSSSQHLKATHIDERSARNILPSRSYEESISTPRGAGTQAAFVDQLVSYPDAEPEHTVVQSPSASLKQLTRLETQPVPAIEHCADQDDNALWRQFVFGSQDGSSETSQSTAVRAEETSNRLPRAASPSTPVVSGLGTSEGATRGNSIFTGTSISDEKTARSISQALEASHQQQESLVDLAEQREERDSIEDVQSPPRPRRQGNIHAASTCVLNQRRFDRKTPVAAEGFRRPTLQPPRQRRVGNYRPAKAAYGLIDSDGGVVG